MKSILDLFKLGVRSSRSTKSLGDDDGSNAPKLPQPLTRHLSGLLQALPSHPAYCQAIQSRLTKAVQEWQQEPDTATNSLVILGNPVVSLAPVVRAAIAQWQHPEIQIVQLQRDWSTRPQNYAQTKVQLAQEIKADFQPLGAEFQGERSNGNTHTLITLPCLDWCFLRCVDGLDAIEYLRDTVLTDQSRFWLIGCNHWAWDYLNYVCQVEAYFRQTISLPSLSPLDLRDWLAPVINTLDLNFGSEADPVEAEVLSQGWLSRTEQKYFGTLASVSTGVSTIATHLWLRSLAYSASIDSDLPTVDVANASNPSIPALKHIQRGKIKLPPLPNFTAAERYLLFSLLLHGEMSLSHLALSLGEDESFVQAQVQLLRQAGIVEQGKRLLWVDPAYYAGIQLDLRRNNFLLAKQD